MIGRKTHAFAGGSVAIGGSARGMGTELDVNAVVNGMDAHGVGGL